MPAAKKAASRAAKPAPAFSTNPAVDHYIAGSPEFAQPILHYLRQLMHQAAPLLVEEMKWSRPFFVQNGVILGNMSAFQRHCSFGLWGCEPLEAIPSTAEPGGMGTFGKLTAISDLPPRSKLLAMIREASARIHTGQRTTSWSRPRVAKPEPAVPVELQQLLQAQPTLAHSFGGLTAGCRREYCEWIDQAKRTQTRLQRAQTAAQWIAQGKSRYWKYEAR